MDDIYKYIIAEEISYKTMPVPIVDGYEWHMHKHIQLSTLYKNSRLETGNTDDKPVKNIIRPILNVSYRSEGFDVKDIEPYVNSEKDYFKSFLVKKFHAKWAKKNDMDTFIDELVESYVDYGGALVKNVNGIRPEVVPFQRLAFCDQTDLLAGVICEKHMYTPDQLREMDDRWDKEKIDEAITMALAEKANSQVDGQKAKTPGKYIEVYELHGVMPTKWLEGEDNVEGMNTDEYTRQAQYITFYKSRDNQKHGITLFKIKETNPIYKAIIRDKIYGRALGFGGIEELFEAQVWTNYSMIQIKKMLDAAALMILQTADKSYGAKNKITDLAQGEILTHEPDAPLTQVTFQPQNMQQFESSVIQWENHARTTGSANDAQLGENPTAGTPFKLQELVVNQGQSIHEWRKGKIATFVTEIYRDWIIDYLVSDMNDGQKWLDELTLDEMNYIADAVAVNESNKRIKDIILQGGMVTPEMQNTFIQLIKDDFKKGGAKKFMEIFEGEMEDAPIDVNVNIAGKNKYLNLLTDKLTNIFREVIGNPNVLANPGMAKLFNQIVEYSGLDPVDFSGLEKNPIAPQGQGAMPPQASQMPQMPQAPQLTA